MFSSPSQIYLSFFLSWRSSPTNRCIASYSYGVPGNYSTYLVPHLNSVENTIREMEIGLPDHTPKLSEEDARVIRARPLPALRNVSWVSERNICNFGDDDASWLSILQQISKQTSCSLNVQGRSPGDHVPVISTNGTPCALTDPKVMSRVSCF